MVKNRQAVLWISYLIVVFAMVATAKTLPGLSNLLAVPAIIGLFAVPIVSCVWSEQKPAPPCNYTSADAMAALAEACDWEAELDDKVDRLVKGFLEPPVGRGQASDRYDDAQMLLALKLQLGDSHWGDIDFFVKHLLEGAHTRQKFVETYNYYLGKVYENG